MVRSGRVVQIWETLAKVRFGTQNVTGKPSSNACNILCCLYGVLHLCGMFLVWPPYFFFFLWPQGQGVLSALLLTEMNVDGI